MMTNRRRHRILVAPKLSRVECVCAERPLEHIRRISLREVVETNDGLVLDSLLLR